MNKEKSYLTWQDRKPILLSKNAVALIQIFHKSDEIFDAAFDAFGNFDTPGVAEEAAKEFIRQLKDEWTPRFLTALLQELKQILRIDWSLAFYLHKMGDIDEPWAYRDPHVWRDKLGDGLWHCRIESVGGPIMETTAETPTDAVKACYEKMMQLQTE